MKRLNKKTRILVVEDHPRLREFLVELLRSHGHGVVSAADGACALAEMTRCRPDVVLTDLIMPRVNGLELLRAMRGVEELRGIPVVMLTAVGSETLQEEARRAGVREVLTKPLNAPELLRLLADLVEEASRSDRRNLAVCSRWDIWPICSGVPLPLLQGVELDIDFSNLQKPSPPACLRWHRVAPGDTGEHRRPEPGGAPLLGLGGASGGGGSPAVAVAAAAGRAAPAGKVPGRLAATRVCRPPQRVCKEASWRAGICVAFCPVSFSLVTRPDRSAYFSAQ